MFIPELFLTAIIIVIGIYFFYNKGKIEKKYEEKIKELKSKHLEELNQLSTELQSIKEESEIKEVSLLLNCSFEKASEVHKNLTSSLFYYDFKNTTSPIEKKDILTESELSFKNRSKRISFIHSILNKNNLHFNQEYVFEWVFSDFIEGEEELELKDLDKDEQKVIQFCNENIDKILKN